MSRPSTDVPAGSGVADERGAVLTLAPPVTSDDASDSETPGSSPVSLRDVWRAARARRRALRGEVRRFTARARRRRALWIGVAASVVLLVVGSVAAAYSPLFAVQTVRVLGTQTLAVDVADALSAQIGVPLPSVDESAVKQALIAFPLVESYTLEARPPHELVIRIVERTPIGVIETDAGWSLVDAAGVVLETTPAAPAGRPVISAAGGPGSDAFASIGLVMRALPATILAQVTAVAATTRDDVTLTLGATGTQVVWGSVDASPMKALVLEKAMVARPPSGVSMYDVSSPSAIVIR